MARPDKESLFGYTAPISRRFLSKILNFLRRMPQLDSSIFLTTESVELNGEQLVPRLEAEEQRNKAGRRDREVFLSID